MMTVFKVVALLTCEVVLSFVQLLVMAGLAEIIVNSGVTTLTMALILVAMATVFSVGCAGTYWIIEKIADLILENK